MKHMNKELLLKVAQDLVSQYERFDMGDYINTSEITRCKGRVCPTSFCIGGDGVLLNGNFKITGRGADRHIVPLVKGKSGDWLEAGMEAFGITIAQAERLFYDYNWPEDFRVRDYNTPFAAAMGAARILHFINTNGRE